MRILVTGGAGYIGSTLVPALLAAGHRVTVLDNFMYGQTSLLGVASHENLRIVAGDARNYDEIKPLVCETELVIPLAAIVGAPACDRDAFAATSTNLDAIRDLCWELTHQNQGILIPTSNSGYGTGGEDECTEESPLRPISLYGQTKVEAERAVMERGNSVSLRLATVFGCSPRMRLDLMVNDFAYRAAIDRTLVLFQGRFRRNFVHVRDVARAFLHVIANWETMRDQVYNVGDTRANMTKLDLCVAVQRVVPGFHFYEAEFGEDPDKRDYVVSNAKFEATGWNSAYDISNGIREVAAAAPMLRAAGIGALRNA